MVVDHIDDGCPVLAMDYSATVGGRPGYLHGGAIGGMLEMAAFAALRAHLSQRELDLRIKPVNVSIEFLRGGQAERTFARGTVLRAGRRLANVRVEAWQSDPQKPVASCWMNFLLSPR
ncbi:PaaI family thioesterase [Novosphingobium cyanobacteriorum]|uniref:PaaI family thioesterase n=1 Tax=Novosphingobium cyanobacteriorum TaxID=3024215 RepID=A0ABT6CF25_9SPHN|nr:PaaI family thioesterase [Novosphingobium cyanobacteriorum]MDF8332511.1 PaaI family thioesterase [Novosphingobium cyanobacteriorum]